MNFVNNKNYYFIYQNIFYILVKKSGVIYMKNENLMLNKNEIISKKINFCVLECTSGKIWITYKNSGDIILSKGNSICIEKKTKILIQAMDNSKTNIFYPESKPERKSLISLKNSIFFSNSAKIVDVN